MGRRERPPPMDDAGEEESVFAHFVSSHFFHSSSSSSFPVWFLLGLRPRRQKNKEGRERRGQDPKGRKWKKMERWNLVPRSSPLHLTPFCFLEREKPQLCTFPGSGKTRGFSRASMRWEKLPPALPFFGGGCLFSLRPRGRRQQEKGPRPLRAKEKGEEQMG